MEEIHTILHQITSILGVKQCTATQALGICIEFWVGAAAALGLIKVKDLLNIKKKFEAITSQEKTEKKTKKKKKKKKANKKSNRR